MDFRTVSHRVFGHIEDVIYVFVGLLLVAAALLLIVNTADALIKYHFSGDSLIWIVDVLDRVLLLLMVIEIVHTVRVSLRDHVLRPEPFLIVGLIATIRRILVISVEVAYEHEMFREYMIEIGVLAGVILVLVASTWWLGRTRQAESSRSA